MKDCRRLAPSGKSVCDAEKDLERCHRIHPDLRWRRPDARSEIHGCFTEAIAGIPNEVEIGAPPARLVGIAKSARDPGIGARGQCAIGCEILPSVIGPVGEPEETMRRIDAAERDIEVTADIQDIGWDIGDNLHGSFIQEDRAHLGEVDKEGRLALRIVLEKILAL